MVIRNEFGHHGGAPPPPNVTEQWSAVDPPRWRVVTMIPLQSGVFDSQGGPISGRQEISYADGVQRTFLAQPNTLLRQEGYRDDGPAARVPSTIGRGGDPAIDLRAMLASGEVTDAGEHRVRGRTVRRLVSESSRDSTARRRLVYDVHPETFAPVQGSLTVTVGARGRHPIEVGSRFVVERYERLPLTGENAKLLTISTNADTTVVVRTAAELRRRQEAMRRWRRRCVTTQTGAQRCPPPPPELSHPLPPRRRTP